MEKEDDMQDLKQRDTEKDSLDEYRGKWRNACFLRDGSTLIGAKLYDSEADALLGIAENWDARNDIFCAGVTDGKRHALWPEVSHFIPVPASQ